MTEVLFNTSILTDMGCTFRLLRRDALDMIRPHLTIGGSHFGPQILLEVIAHHIPFVEIPLNYRPRVGVSAVTGSLWTAFWLGMRMIVLVLGYRFGWYPRQRATWHEPEMADSIARLATGGIPGRAAETTPSPRQELEHQAESSIRPVR
jgi:hypothetical protein